MDLTRALELAGGQQLGVLTTLKQDGRPQLSNIAYGVGDDGLVRISVTDDRAKTRNLRRDPRASLYVGRKDGWAYLVLEGRPSSARSPPRPTTKRSRSSSRCTRSSKAITPTGTRTAGRW